MLLELSWPNKPNCQFTLHSVDLLDTLSVPERRSPNCCDLTMETAAARVLPLQGLRVLEMGQLVAGPFAGCILGYFGAEVIKVEPPHTGDALRSWRILSLCSP